MTNPYPEPIIPTDVPMPEPGTPEPGGPPGPAEPYPEPIIPTDVPMPDPRTPEPSGPPMYAPGADPGTEGQET